MDKTVVLGLSGGVDSLVSSILLKEQGYRVIACTFKLWNNDDSIEKARELAETIGVEFRVLDISEPFKNQIVDPFIRDYIGGETPNPCVWCNNEIKVYYLYQEMINSKADFFATGHYIQIQEHQKAHYIYRGIDEAKDQSYFLWNVRAKYLKYWLTPLGGFTKKNVKQIAIDHKMGFLAHKKESMGVCFIGDAGYHQFLDEHKTDEQNISSGDIVDKDNNILGQHKGTPFYTIGQKKGLELEEKGIAVVGIDAKNNKLIVGENKELFVNEFVVRDYYFIDESDMQAAELYVWVRGLGRNPEGFCRVKVTKDNRLIIVLEYNAWAMAAGQPVAFYIKERLVGGGYVDCE